MAPSVRCPRCGYNLAGTMSTWTHTCPLEGRCPECGLDLEWSEIFARADHPWLFEYHWRRRPVRRLLQTIVHATRPARFWREVRMTDPVHLRPAAFLVGLSIAVGLVVVLGQLVYLDHTLFRIWKTPTRGGVRYWLSLIGENILWLPANVAHFVPGVLGAALVMPVLFLLMPTSVRRARVRRAHVIRVWLYSLVAPALIVALWGGLYLVASAIHWSVADVVSPWRWFRRGRPDSVLGMLAIRWLPPVVCLGLLVAWLVRWWALACRWYLRLDHARWIAVLFGVITLALGLLVESFAEHLR